MRDSSYKVLEALISEKCTWTAIKDSAKLSDGGLQKVLRDLVKNGIVDEDLKKGESGLKTKIYKISQKAKKERIYEKAKELKESLERVEK